MVAWSTWDTDPWTWIHQQVSYLQFLLRETSGGFRTVESVGKKLRVVLMDVWQKSETSRLLMEQTNRWKTEERALTAKIRYASRDRSLCERPEHFRSLETKLTENESAGRSAEQMRLKEKQNVERMMNTLQEAKKTLETENNKLNHACALLKRKQRCRLWRIWIVGHENGWVISV